jgi:protein gp37
VTTIEWTDATWNPTRGCRRVSEECTHCYAEADAHRRNLMATGLGRALPYEGLVRLGPKGEPRWTGDGRFVPEKLAEPLSWRRPRRVFVDSMSDLFFEVFSFEQIAAVFGVMAACPQHTFQILTKRPDRARDFMRWIVDQDLAIEDLGGCTPGLLHANAAALAEEARVGGRQRLHMESCADPSGPWPLPNVWLGVSCGIRSALPRLDVLRQMPAARRFVSFEPLLEDLGDDVDLRGIDWAIIGGESGRGARSMDVGWARALVAAARFAGAAPFVKQLGDRPAMNGAPVRVRAPKGGDPSEWPADLRVREMPADSSEVAP